jgi:hypothetical protein
MSEGLDYKKAVIDEELRPFISWLNKNCYPTIGCCYGHPPDFNGYIKFDKRVNYEDIINLFHEFNNTLEHTSNYFVYDKKKNSVNFSSRVPLYGKSLEEYMREWVCHKS